MKIISTHSHSVSLPSQWSWLTYAEFEIIFMGIFLPIVIFMGIYLHIDTSKVQVFFPVATWDFSLLIEAFLLVHTTKFMALCSYEGLCIEKWFLQLPILSTWIHSGFTSFGIWLQPSCLLLQLRIWLQPSCLLLQLRSETLGELILQFISVRTRTWSFLLIWYYFHFRVDFSQ